MILEAIVPYRVYVNQVTNQLVSLFGACPHPAHEFKVETRGFTTSWSNGTRGHGQMPFKTIEEAKAFVATYNERRKAYGAAPVAVTFPEG